MMNERGCKNKRAHDSAKMCRLIQANDKACMCLCVCEANFETSVI